MDGWLEIATGPLFAAAFLVMVLGLARHVLLQLCLVVTKASTLRRVRWRRAVTDSLGWIVPVRHLVPGTLILSLTSILFHAGVILVPIFLADHVALWEAFLGVGLPSIGRGLADVLTLVTIGCRSWSSATCAGSASARAASRRASRPARTRRCASATGASSSPRRTT